MTKRIVIGITGASGMIYARRLLDILSKSEIELDVVLSNAAWRIIKVELGAGDEEESHAMFDFDLYFPGVKCGLYAPDTLDAPFSSGSVRVDGMVIVPCSMTTLGKIASGIGDNLISRAAGVMLKEQRKLILVPRETPLSAIYLENMLRLSRAGALIMPACPGFYHKPGSIDDLVDSIVGRILDHLDIPHDLKIRWSGE
jgi:4-hydroxy-3-polyprenylbenzoate decarboxylase